MKKQRKHSYDLLLFIVLLSSFLVISLLITGKNDNDKNVKEDITVNFSSLEYSNLDFENVTYSVSDSNGNSTRGKEWFGVNGLYYQEKPLIFGSNTYSYWVENDSYFIKPEDLIPDVYHRNQSVILEGIKIENISEHNLKVRDNLNYDVRPNEISLKYDEGEGYYSYFSIEYYADKITKMPFGGTIIFEYDRQLNLDCELPFSRVPYSYISTSINNGLNAYLITQDFDEGNYVRQSVNCKFEKNWNENLELNSDYLKITIIPIIPYLEDKEIKYDTEDKESFSISKSIYQTKFKITR